MAYTILAVNPGHNGSVALVIDGEVIFYVEEERLSRLKYDGNPFRGMIQILTSIKVDELILGGTSEEFSQLQWTGENAFVALARKFNPQVKVSNLGGLHHLGHAANAFFASGFESAAAVVVDGAGSFHKEQLFEGGPITGGFETETIYACSYPATFDAVYKRYSDTSPQNPYYDNGIQEFDSSSVTMVKAYEAVSEYLGFGFIEAGKTMGLSPYGVHDEDIPSFFLNGKGNNNLLIPSYPAGAFINENRYPYLKRTFQPSDWHSNPDLIRQVDKNIAFKIQHETEELMMNLIQKAIDLTGETNIVLSGGFALNCVANYKYVERFPEIKFFIDPIAHDGGTAIGLARYAWHKQAEDSTIRELKSVYLGPNPDYSQLSVIEEHVKDAVIDDISTADVAKLLSEGKIGSVFQGKSEGGPRALCNRSIIFDSRAENGKDIINSVKRREWFRPFAGTILKEDAADWFEMLNIEESPFMMYAIKVKEDKKDKIPAVLHVDGTCRIQTVTVEQNKAMFDLLTEFKTLTEVPCLLNTSFNLAGDPLVDSLFDAVNTLMMSSIDFIWLPEIGKIIRKA